MRVWRTALRIARREARRAKGRSALVVAMIAVPVLCLSFAAVMYDMLTLTPHERVTRGLGTADARVAWIHDGPIAQTVGGEGGYPVGAPGPSNLGEVSDATLLGALPPGSRVVRERHGEVQVRTASGVGGVETHVLDLSDPLWTGRVLLLSGRAPARADEVAISEQAIGRIGTRTGGTVELADDAGRRFTVTAIVEFPDNLRPTIVFHPDGMPPGVGGPGDGSPAWFVDTPEPVSWAQVRQLNQRGILVTSASVLLDPPPESQRYSAMYELGGGPELQQFAVGGLIAGLGLLEVVLLAGPAFVVSARRRQRQLAIVAANGGTAAHIRRIVLADGVVLGGVAGIGGIGLGIATAFATRPLVEEYLAHSRAGGYRVFPLALLAIAGVALTTGVLGALVPAFVTARQDVVAALSGRRGITRSRKRWLVTGLAMCAAGAGIATFGAWQVSTNIVLAGLILSELGLVLCTPALVGLVARVGRFLPLAPRIALRDTARNRAAAAPAISAVMAAVAGAVAMGVYLGSSWAQSQVGYRPFLTMGSVALLSPPPDGGTTPTPQRAEALRSGIRDAVPEDRVVDLYELACDRGPDGCEVSIDLPAAALCPYTPAGEQPSRAEVPAAKRDVRCTDTLWGYGVGGVTAVDDGTALPMLTGAPADAIPAATAALRAGSVVVTSPLVVVDGMVTLRVVRFKSQSDATGVQVSDVTARRQVTVPAHVLATGRDENPRWSRVVLSQAAADQLGVPVRWGGVLASTTRIPTRAEEDRLHASARDLVASGFVERGPRHRENPILLVLALAAGVITLGAAGIATGLAAADGRADLSTLAAVGASPRMRRMLSLSQSGVIAGLGALLGAVAGVGAASAVLVALNQVYANEWPAPPPYPIVLPWQSLGVVVVVVPLVAMLGAGLLTRSRLPIERRLA